MKGSDPFTVFHSVIANQRFRFRSAGRADRSAPAGRARAVATAGAVTTRGAIEHTSFARLGDHLRSGDLLVLNDTRVFPARLVGHRVPSGGAVECLLLRKLPSRDSGSRIPGSRIPSSWECLMHPGQKLKPGARVLFERDDVQLHGEVLARHFHGRRTIRLWATDRSVSRGYRADRPHSVASLHRAPGRSVRSRTLSDRLRSGAGIGCGADGGTALHAARCSRSLQARGVERDVDHAACRIRNVQAGQGGERRRARSRSGGLHGFGIDGGCVDQRAPRQAGASSLSARRRLERSNH